MAYDGTDELDPLRKETLLLPPVEVPPRRVVGSGLWAFTVLLAFVGGAAVLLAVGLVLLVGVLRSGDPGLNQAVDRFVSTARELPGVRSAAAKPGLGDLGTTPKDIYGDVHLDDDCTAASLATTAAGLRTIATHERAYLLHPTVWCRGRGLTVSPVAAVTKQRLEVVGQLTKDRSLNAAALIVTQVGDDPSPDRDNGSVQLHLYVRPRSGGEIARAWLNRLRPTLPHVTVSASSGRPGDYLDAFALQKGQWTVVVRAQDPQSGAVLRIARRMEQSPNVLGAYIDGSRREVAVLSSTWDVLRRLSSSLPTPSTDDQPFRVTVTMSQGPDPTRSSASLRSSRTS